MNDHDLKFPIHPAKRCFDIVFSLFVLIVFSPLILFFLIAIIIEHSIRLRPFDPLFYSEIRMSQGRPFMMYKFNIFTHDVVTLMRARGEFIHTKQLEHNGSLLCVGYVLKQIYLDELPQFFNILVGDMSLVGPRPVNEKVHAYFIEKGILDKLKVKAGLTGHFQSHKHTAGATTEEMDRVYVEYYFNNPWYKILLFDFKIIFRTVKILLLAKGI